MKFNITGIKDRKIIIALRKLARSFHAELSDSEDAIEVQIEFFINDDTILVKLFSMNQEYFKNTTVELDRETDLKYLILACFYQFLSTTTKKELSYGVLNGIRPTKLVHRYKKAHLRDEDIVKKLNEKYLVSLEKAKLLLNIVNNEYNSIPHFDKLHEEISVYLHIPFCLSKCSYCSFTSYKVEDLEVSEEDYLDKLSTEILALANYIKEHQLKITTIYVGGGTPTALSEKNLYFLLTQIESHLVNDKILEFTLECGRPDSLTLEKLKIIKMFSVSRISINPQTFNDNTLKQMNRNHTSNDIKLKMQEARDLGFTNINMDLIIGLPNETTDDYKNSIDEVIRLNPESITIHNLALKKGSHLLNHELSPEESIFQAFEYSYKELKKFGYNPYYLYRQKNISGNLDNIGYSKKGYESIYNITMIEEVQNIIGLGCGSSSKFLNHELILNPKNLVSYTKSYQEYLDKKLRSLHKSLTELEDKK